VCDVVCLGPNCQSESPKVRAALVAGAAKPRAQKPEPAGDPDAAHAHGAPFDRRPLTWTGRIGGDVRYKGTPRNETLMAETDVEQPTVVKIPAAKRQTPKTVDETGRGQGYALGRSRRYRPAKSRLGKPECIQRACEPNFNTGRAGQAVGSRGLKFRAVRCSCDKTAGCSRARVVQTRAHLCGMLVAHHYG